MDKDPTFGQLLVQFRDYLRISQTRLAHKCFVDHSYISRLESGDRRPNSEFLEVLFRTFDVPAPTRLAMYNAAGFADPTYTKMLEDLPTPILEFLELTARAEQAGVSLMESVEFRGTLNLLKNHVKTLTHFTYQRTNEPPRIAYTDPEKRYLNK